MRGDRRDMAAESWVIVKAAHITERLVMKLHWLRSVVKLELSVAAYRRYVIFFRGERGLGLMIIENSKVIADVRPHHDCWPELKEDKTWQDRQHILLLQVPRKEQQWRDQYILVPFRLLNSFNNQCWWSIHSFLAGMNYLLCHRTFSGNQTLWVLLAEIQARPLP